MPATIRVRAVDGHAVPFVDETGRPCVGRFVGRARRTADDRLGAVRLEGEEIPDLTYYRRFVGEGALELL